MMNSARKLDAIYELRRAAEQKALAERDAVEHPSPQKRDALLTAQLDLEEKTLDAIEICHECGHEHAPDAGHTPPKPDNVISLDERRDRD